MDVNEIESMLARSALGDRKAFSRLYDLTSGKLLGVCMRILKERSSAEDTLQIVYVKIWNNAGRYQVTGRGPMAWLVTIARNAAIDQLRARKPETDLGDYQDVLAAPGLTPEQATVAASEAARLANCLSKLKPDRSEAVKGAYLKGQTYRDLADQFSVPINTMRTWLRQSLISLRECMSHDE